MGDQPRQQTAAVAEGGLGRGRCTLQLCARDLRSESWTFSEPPTRIRGLHWRVAAHVISGGLLQVKLCCCNGDNAKAVGWSCSASVRYSVNARLEGDNDEWGQEHDHCGVFSAGSEEELNSLQIGLSNDYEWAAHDNDLITVEADICADPPLGLCFLPKLDLLVINGQPVNVNKELLAAHSSFFKTLFFNQNFKESADNEFKLQIAEPPASVGHFERLVALMYPLMYPEYKPIDDNCVEGVLHLANQYQIEVVEGICLEFLRTKSKKSALFKYRMAAKYGYNGLKDYVLWHMTKQDFDGANFEANVHECFALGGGGDNDDAFQALMHRYRELYRK